MEALSPKPTHPKILKFNNRVNSIDGNAIDIFRHLKPKNSQNNFLSPVAIRARKSSFLYRN